jgi:16S rRNA (cytosine1402-N4)-methyltransferase
VAVLQSEVLQHLRIRPGATVIDATIGLGGHAELLLQAAGSEGRLIGLDADADSLETARARLSGHSNVQLYRENFANVVELARKEGLPPVDALLADLGISSRQLGSAERGFSFTLDAPLDMRIDQRLPQTAADLVNSLDESQLADVLFFNSQERFSRRIAKAVRLARHQKRIQTTGQLADIVCRALQVDARSRARKIHPATRTFMALRMAVNDEMNALRKLLDALPVLLAPGGRAAIISFHSLEDGACKQAFRRLHREGLVTIVTPKPVTASSEERQQNPRSRSAKLRVVERTSVACAA